MKQTIANLCYGMGFASVAISIGAYAAWGIDEATYVGLWVPSFVLIGLLFEKWGIDDGKKTLEKVLTFFQSRLQ